MAGRYDSDPFDEYEVNPFSVSVNYPCVYFCVNYQECFPCWKMMSQVEGRD
jgi:hypothetical protein